MAGILPGGSRYCVICGETVHRFLPFAAEPSTLPVLMSALALVGSDLKAFECPRCGSHDRERHLLLYMQAHGLTEGLSSKRILHFAPEKRIAKIWSKSAILEYVQCDLYPSSGDVQKIDISDIPYPDETFDLVIANHVLEHVENDISALREVKRVLRVGGHAILQTPFSKCLLATWQDDGISSSEARAYAYGQSDHSRLYGRDIVERFASVGLTPCIRDHANALPAISADKFGVNREEPFFLFLRDS